MKRYFIEFSYCGSGFHGWQTQSNAITVQQTMEEGLRYLLRSEITLTGAGRTDTGVHASYFVAHFDCEEIKNPGSLVNRLNRYFKSSITIFRVSEINPEAHARFNALQRTYKYLILREKHSFLSEYSMYFTGRLDLELMRDTSSLLSGIDDFSSFAKLHSNNKTNLCNIFNAGWSGENGFLVFTITADRFLRNMVRSLTATILDVGKLRISPEEFKEIVKSRDNRQASASVPAKGLFLWDIRYPDEYNMVNPVLGRSLPFL